MNKFFRMGALAAALFLSGASFAQADTPYFQTADYQAGEMGDYFIDNTDFYGAAFHVTSAVDITGIGGYFTQYSDGNIFGAIVSMDPMSGMPGDVASTALAHVTFAADGTDQFVAMPVHLNAGNYAVVFGSGLFDATGYSGLVNGQGTTGSPSVYSFDGSSWSSSGNTDVRMTVFTAPVPEADNLALMLSGLGVLGLVLRRKQNA